jgi:hypothetical protein
LPETTKPGGQQETPSVADAPRTLKKEVGVASRKVHRTRIVIDEPENFVDEAHLES